MNPELSMTLLKCLIAGTLAVFTFSLWYVSITEWRWGKQRRSKTTDNNNFRKMRIYMEKQFSRERRAVHFAMQFTNYYLPEGRSIEEMAKEKKVSVNEAQELVNFGNELLNN